MYIYIFCNASITLKMLAIFYFFIWRIFLKPIIIIIIIIYSNKVNFDCGFVDGFITILAGRFSYFKKLSPDDEHSECLAEPVVYFPSCIPYLSNTFRVYLTINLSITWLPNSSFGFWTDREISLFQIFQWCVFSTSRGISKDIIQIVKI